MYVKLHVHVHVNPSCNLFSVDKTKFGFRMLEKMGWRDGRGLGVNEDGNKEHVKIHKKDDNLGRVG